MTSERAMALQSVRQKICELLSAHQGFSSLPMRMSPPSAQNSATTSRENGQQSTAECLRRPRVLPAYPGVAICIVAGLNIHSGWRLRYG